MSVKSDLMAEIEAKSKKIKERREKARTKGSVEQFVFDFFKEADDMKRLSKVICDETGERNQEIAGVVLTAAAATFLEKQLQQRFDRDCRVELSMTEKGHVQGVLIHWSKSYQVAYRADEMLYVGVEQLLFN